GYRMELVTHIAHLTKAVRWNAEFGVNLVDHRPRPTSAFIVHRRDFLFRIGAFNFFEDNDLGVLSAQFDHAHHIGIELFHGEGNGIHFLDETGTDMATYRRAARA